MKNTEHHKLTEHWCQISLHSWLHRK